MRSGAALRPIDKKCSWRSLLGNCRFRAMPTLPDFRLETHFSRWEFKAKHHLTASDAESISMRELLAMASPEDREAFDSLWLGYTETFGAPDLREAIAGTYLRQSPSDILCFAGASEGIFAANNVILDVDSHAIVVTPNYQSHETLPLAICEAIGVPFDPVDNWSLDIDRIGDAIRPNTRLVTMNFPHRTRAGDCRVQATGCKRRWVRGPGRPARHLPAMQRMRGRAGQAEDARGQGARLRRLRSRA